MSLAWLVGAVVIAAACFVQGLAGFGIGLVSLAFLPFLMSPQHAIVLITLYAAVFIVIIFIPLRRDFTLHGMIELVAGTILATPVGVWLLAGLPSDLLKRLIGLVLLLIVALEWLGLYPQRLRGRGWGFGAGVAAGILGGAIGTPGPPVILYAAAQDWSPRTVKANIQAFLIVNQAVILIGYWWAGPAGPRGLAPHLALRGPRGGRARGGDAALQPARPRALPPRGVRGAPASRAWCY